MPPQFPPAPARSLGHPGWPRTARERYGVAALGLIAGVDGIGYSVAIAALLFTGTLSRGLGVATGSSLLCTAVVALFVGVRSRIPTNIAHVQDVAVAVLATMFSRTGYGIATAFAIVGATSFATGAACWLTGRLRIGRIVKYFPQAVLAGFLAGTGWLLLRGGVVVALGYTPTLRGFGDTSAISVRRVLLALAMALCLLVVMSTYHHPVALLSVLVGSVLGFYCWIWLSPTTIASATAERYLPTTYESGGLHAPFPSLLDEVNWAQVWRATPTILTIAMLCLFAMLMNSAALGRATGVEVDLDAELRDTGIANVLVAAVGAPPGYTGLSISVLGNKAGVRHRGAGIIAGAIVLLGFVFARQIVTHVPTFVSAGFIMFLGIDLLTDWIVRALRTYSSTEAATVLLILGFVVFFGFLQATVAGFVVATLLFAVSYARIPIIRSVASLTTIASTTERPPQDAEVLRTAGDAVSVVRLQGYLFFGSTERIVAHVSERIVDSTRPPLQVIVLDLALVPGIDAASAAALDRVRLLGAQHGFEVALSGAIPSVLAVLKRCKVEVADGATRDRSRSADAMSLFPSLDEALLAAEGRLLEMTPPSPPLSFYERVGDHASDVMSDEQFDALVSHMRRTTHDPGETILRAGDPGDELLIVQTGTVAVLRRAPSGAVVQLRQMSAGAVVGDIGFVLGQVRTADIVAAQSAAVLRITRAEADALDPVLGAMLHRIISRGLAEKVLTANRMTDHIRS